MSKPSFAQIRSSLFDNQETISGTQAALPIQDWLGGTSRLPGASPIPVNALQIIDGMISPLVSMFTVDTEGGAPADDLRFIDIGNTHDGMEISITSTSSARMIKIVRSDSINGIWLHDDDEKYLDYLYPTVFKRSGTRWIEMPRIKLGIATEEERGIGRVATGQEWTTGVTGENGPAWLTSERVKPDIKIINDSIAASKQSLHVQDRKPVGTDGGTATAGAWRTRDINTVVINTIPGASLANNQITLPIGSYYVDASAPAYSVGQHRVSLYNVTSPGYSVGQNAYAKQLTGSVATAQIKMFITISSTTVFELRHTVTETMAGIGFGIAQPSFAIQEIYSDVIIRRIS